MKDQKKSAKEKKPVYGQIGANLGQLRKLEQAQLLEDMDRRKNEKFNKFIEFVGPMLDNNTKINWL